MRYGNQEEEARGVGGGQPGRGRGGCGRGPRGRRLGTVGSPARQATFGLEADAVSRAWGQRDTRALGKRLPPDLRCPVLGGGVCPSRLREEVAQDFQAGLGAYAQAVQDNGSGKKAAMTEKLKRTRGSGNVFLDVGFPPDEAENLLLRAQLMSRIRDVVRRTTQREAAKQFGVSQPRLNDVMRGKIGKFSLDALVNMLGRAGMRVEMKVKRAA